MADGTTSDRPSRRYMPLSRRHFLVQGASIILAACGVDRLLPKSTGQGPQTDRPLAVPIIRGTEAGRTTGGWANVDDYGAVGDGTTDDSAAIEAAFNASKKVAFSPKVYRINKPLVRRADNLEVYFGNATILNGGAGTAFTFGETADTPRWQGLKLTGGTFQLAPHANKDLNFIRIGATRGFSLTHFQLKDVANGGVIVEGGCEDGLIGNGMIEGHTSTPIKRGIWLAGSTVSDYTEQLIDVESITRNAARVPQYGVKNVKVVDVAISVTGFGIYFMNTRDCHIENCSIDISNSGGRCISLNTYSPGARVSGCTLRGNRLSTGILVTQFSHDVRIENNTFLGSFGPARDVYVSYLSDALITGNEFKTETLQNIQIDMGAKASVLRNTFSKPTHTENAAAVLLTTIDLLEAGKGNFGNSAETLPGMVFEHNTLHRRLIGVSVRMLKAANGNIPGLNTVIVARNDFHQMDLATSDTEYPLNINTNGSLTRVKYQMEGNRVFPRSARSRNKVRISELNARS